MSMLKIVGGSPDLFSYAALSRGDEAEVREAAERIKLRLRRTAEDIIEIGRDLIAVKERLPHGQFLPWLEAEFGMSDETARKMMRVAEVYGPKIQSGWNFPPPTVMYELAAPKTPLEVREEVEKMIEAGEVVTKATVQELRNKLATTEAAVESLSGRNHELSVKVQAAASQTQPGVDIEAIRAEGAAEAERILKVRIDELAAANVHANDEIRKLRAKAEKSTTALSEPNDGNVVRPSFGGAPDDPEEHDYSDPKSAISAFSGAVGSMEGLEFSPAEFWRQQGRTGTHGKRLHKALLSVNATISLLIKEYTK